MENLLVIVSVDSRKGPLRDSQEAPASRKPIPCKQLHAGSFWGLLIRQTWPHDINVGIMVGPKTDLLIRTSEVLCEEGDRKQLLFLNALGLHK